MDNTDLNIVRFDAGRLKDLETLHTAVYGKAPEKGMYQKKYDTGYTGHLYLGFIAYTPEGIAAAYYGVVPCSISLQGKMLPAAQSADTMTHPLHRKKGLFAVLAKKTYELCLDEGIRLIFGFPNQNSYPAFVNHLGWKYMEHMSLFVIPVEAPSFFQRFTGRLFPNYLLRKHLLPAQGLSNRLVEDGFAGIWRDEQYLNYRTYHSTMVIACGDAKAWIRPASSLFVGDMDVKEHQLHCAVKVLTKIARQLGIRDLSFQVSPGTPLHRLLSERYRSRPSFPVIVKDLGSGIPLEQLKFTFADIDIF